MRKFIKNWNKIFYKNNVSNITKVTKRKETRGIMRIHNDDFFHKMYIRGIPCVTLTNIYIGYNYDNYFGTRHGNLRNVGIGIFLGMTWFYTLPIFVSFYSANYVFGTLIFAGKNKKDEN